MKSDDFSDSTIMNHDFELLAVATSKANVRTAIARPYIAIGK